MRGTAPCVQHVPTTIRPATRATVAIENMRDGCVVCGVCGACKAPVFSDTAQEPLAICCELVLDELAHRQLHVHNLVRRNNGLRHLHVHA